MASVDNSVPGPPRHVFSSAQCPPRNPGCWVCLDVTEIYPDALRWLLQAEGERPQASQTSSSAVEIPLHVLGSAIIRVDSEDHIDQDAFASVYPGQLELPERRLVPVAIRVYHKDAGKTQRQLLARLMNIWPTLNHPRILPLLGYGSLGPITALIIPYFGAGDRVQSYLNDHPQLDRCRLIIQIAEGLDYLHNQMGIVHGDLKVLSVFINANGDAVLSGFALSTSAFKSPLLTPTMTEIRRSNTPRYAAPEILVDECRDASGKRSKTTESDIYAFGMLVYEILSNQSPWKGSNDIKMIADVTRGQRPPRPEESQMNDFMWNLCVACWDQNPARRPRIADILAGLRSPELAGRWQVSNVEEPEAVDPFAESATGDGPESPVRSEYHTPALSPSDQSFHTCASWASTPLRATALIDVITLPRKVSRLLEIISARANFPEAFPKRALSLQRLHTLLLPRHSSFT